MATRRTSAPKGAPLSAFQRLQDQLKWVDLVFEVRDARAPRSSGHPRTAELFGSKPRVIILAKQDLADNGPLSAWVKALSDGTDRRALALALKQTRGKEKVIALALELTSKAREAHTRKGLLPRPMRACVVGMPNVGKSSLINWLIGRKKTLVGNKPGVTKGSQWVRLHPALELLDTPGILPSTSLPEWTRLKLALLNLLPEQVYDSQEIAAEGLKLLERNYPGRLSAYYGAAAGSKPDLTLIAVLRNCVGPGGKPDTKRAASLFLSDLRDGRLGQVLLDSLNPGEESDAG
jgi:ribosome biogenesis GTPase A